MPRCVQDRFRGVVQTYLRLSQGFQKEDRRLPKRTVRQRLSFCNWHVGVRFQYGWQFLTRKRSLAQDVFQHLE